MELIHLQIGDKLDTPEQELALKMLEQMLDTTYSNAELTIERDQYGDLVDVKIQFANLEDETHFKLSHLWIRTQPND